MLSAERTKAISDQIIDLLPDDPGEAVTTLALNYACVASSAGLDDDSAIEAVRRALRQMRAHRVGDPQHSFDA